MTVTITTRQSQLTELTHSQVDSNFLNLAQAVNDNEDAIAAFSLSGGSAQIGNGGESVADSLNALQLPNYAALRAYAGPRKSIYITGYLATAIPTGIAGMIVLDPSDTTSADNNGTCFVDALNRRWKRPYSGPLNVMWFMVKGDGVTDDAPNLQAALDLQLPAYMPYTSTGYLQKSTIYVKSNFQGEGFLVPTTDIASATNPQDRCAVVVMDSGYSVKRRILGLNIQGNPTLKAAGVIGIRVDCPNSWLLGCSVQQLLFGFVVRSYSVTISKCNPFQCTTGISAYARSNSQEINCLVIDGGNYDSSTSVAINLGDTSWPDAMSAGNVHGTNISVINGANTDGAESRADNIIGLHVERTYTEGSNTDAIWLLGGSGDGNMRQVRMRGNFWKNASIAVKCLSAVDHISIEENSLTNISVNEVYLSSDLYPVKYEPGVQVGCFALGQAVRMAFRSLPLASINFANFTLGHEDLRAGIQDCIASPAKWYPGGWVRNANNRTLNISSAVGAFYSAPATNKAGSVNASLFTFTTTTDAKSFNGGDRITLSTGSASYVRWVDYVAGTMLLDGGTAPNGAATISQQIVTTSTVA